MIIKNRGKLNQRRGWTVARNGARVVILTRVDREGPWRWCLSKDVKEVESELCLLKGLQRSNTLVGLHTPTYYPDLTSGCHSSLKITRHPGRNSWRQGWAGEVQFKWIAWGMIYSQMERTQEPVWKGCLLAKSRTKLSVKINNERNELWPIE